jgi:hypothetical protein
MEMHENSFEKRDSNIHLDAICLGPSLDTSRVYKNIVPFGTLASV